MIHSETQWLKLGRRIICETTIAVASLSGLIASAEQPLSQAQTQEVFSPSLGEVIRPFNGQDLTGFSHWLQGLGTEDPNNVYSVVDGTLRISGEGMGYLATVNSYKNYHLRIEYRWGKKTDGSGNVRNSGILLHANGPDGNCKGKWMASVECQLAQGCEGDFIVLRGLDAAGKTVPVTVTSDTMMAADGRTRWKRGGNKTVYTQRQFWWSEHQVGFHELLDTRGEKDVSSPVGEWTLVECICNDNRIVIKINGVTVNECYDVFPSSGKILFENEDNEIFFRNFELSPLSAPPLGTR